MTGFPEDVKLGRKSPKETSMNNTEMAEIAESLGIKNTIQNISRTVRASLSRIPLMAAVLVMCLIAATACDRRDPYNLPYVNGTSNAIQLKDKDLNHILECQRTVAFDLLMRFPRDPKLKRACDDVEMDTSSPEAIVAERKALFESLGLPGDIETWLKIPVGVNSELFKIVTDPEKIDSLPEEVKAHIANADHFSEEAAAQRKALAQERERRLAENPEAADFLGFVQAKDLQEDIEAIADPNE